MHSAIMCKQVNPRIVWCFNSESFMGVCRALGLASAKASGNGLGHKTCNLVMKRYETDLIVPIDHCRLIIVFADWANHCAAWSLCRLIIAFADWAEMAVGLR